MQYMIYGNVIKLGESFFITAEMVDIETTKIVKTSKDKFAKLDDVQDTLKKIVYDLLAVSGSAAYTPPAVQRDGKLKITAHPAGAKVSINGSYAGVAPYTASLKPGEYSVEVSYAGYEIKKSKVYITSDEETHVHAVLTRAKGTLVVRTMPSKANVSMKGIGEGESPFIREVDTGDYEVVIAKDDYITKRIPVTIREKITNEQTAVLVEKDKGSLSLQSEPTGAQIFLAGKPIGITPCVVTLEPGSYELILETPDLPRKKVAVELKKNQTNTMMVPFKFEVSTVELFKKRRETGDSMWRNIWITSGCAGVLAGSLLTGILLNENGKSVYATYMNTVSSTEATSLGDSFTSLFNTADTLFYVAESAIVLTAVFGTWLVFDIVSFSSYDEQCRRLNAGALKLQLSPAGLAVGYSLKF
ncbi:MAG: PEGA domain-containing protein [Spirochaetes bacterium]|nr:PEGA domain-containing protein [Spirochaetota bacterium]